MAKPHYRLTADGQTLRVIRPQDGLRNFASNLMTDRDKAASSSYFFQPLNDGQLAAAYRGSWLPRKIVDIPAEDSTRKWRAWNAEADQITLLEAEEKRLDLRAKVRRAMIAARLRGGAALYIGDGSSDPSQPLNVERVSRNGLRYVTLLTKDHLSPGDVDRNVESPYFNRPKNWMLTGLKGQIEIHPTRLALFFGAPLPEDTFDASYGWGDSILDATYQALTQADATTANIASLIFEAKVDVLSIPNLMRELAEDPRFEETLLTRATTAARIKGINGMLLIDSEEEYSAKSASFANLGEIMDRFFQNVCGAADIPMTRLFGRSAAGMNATGEGDLKNYYDMVQAVQENEVGPALHMLDEALIRSALGSRPEELHYNWRSLWQTTEKERIENGKGIVAMGSLLSKQINPEAARKATTNALIESGAMPGLEAAVDEFGIDVDEPDTDEIAEALARERARRASQVGETAERISET